MLAAELISYVRNHAESQLEKLLDTAEDSENLRLSMIMTLLLQRESYKMGNKASARTDGSKTLYNQQIKEVNARLALFYRAIESKGYDDFANLSRLMNTNSEQLGLLKLDSLQETTIDKREAWQEAAIDLIANYPQYMENYYKHSPMCLNFELIDLNNDQCPEILALDSALDGAAFIEACWTFQGDKYTLMKQTHSESWIEGPIVPVTDAKTRNTLFLSSGFYGLTPEEILHSAQQEDMDMDPYGLLEAVYSCSVQEDRITLQLFYKNAAWEDYRNATSDEEIRSAKKEAAYNVVNFQKRYPLNDEIPYYIPEEWIQVYMITSQEKEENTTSSKVSYQDFMPVSRAQEIVKAYLNLSQ